MKQLLVQILVVVANIQMRTLKTEVEKGVANTLYGYAALPRIATDGSCATARGDGYDPPGFVKYNLGILEVRFTGDVGDSRCAQAGGTRPDSQNESAVGGAFD